MFVSELNSALVKSDSESVLDAAKALLTTENEYCSLISHLHVEASHAHQQANALHNKRFDLLVTSLDLIGRHLERIYKTLVPSGECILRYPTDAVCLFTEGISVCVRQQGVGSVATGGRFWEVCLVDLDISMITEFGACNRLASCQVANKPHVVYR